METTERLISALYGASTEGDWRSFRVRALGLICQELAADAGAWWTRSEGAATGELTQCPHPFVAIAALEKLGSPAQQRNAVVQASPGAVAFLYAQPGSELLHTLVLSLNAKAPPPAAEVIRRVGIHLCEAGALATLQFVRRDDWLHAVGRANRGSAALVDAAGAVHAVSDRFRALLEETTGDSAAARLPFDLPEELLGDNGGEFMHGTLHLRVSRCGGLYLLHARKPLPLDALSPREQEIARAISNGKTLKSIARQYGIAVSTVANHTTRIYRKLAIYRREDLIELLRKRTGTSH
ncbi:MAG: helix-turn-helix transcriptional regulator [Nevskia sp.]|nr:helix-turn-helix transcriptional regulator [Nevskia sp.]